MNHLCPKLYEDDQLLAVAKPAGVSLQRHHASDPPSLLDLVREELPNGDTLSILEPCHRLARYESGIQLLAKSKAMATQIRRLFKAGKARQVYIALVRGPMSRSVIRVAAGHGHSRGERSAGRGRERRSPTPAGVRPASHIAATVIRQLEAGPRRCIVEVTTAAENTHVLRAQLRAADLRLVGDQLGRVATAKPQPASDTLLHLAQLRFDHPDTHRPITLHRPAPRQASQLLGEGLDVDRHLRAGLLQRTGCHQPGITDAHGLLLGPVEGKLPINAERFGPVVVLYALDARSAQRDLLRQVGKWYRKELGVDAVYVKPLFKARQREEHANWIDPISSQPLVGSPSDEEVVVVENGLRYVIRPYDGVAVGLYLDQRDNRARVRQLAAGERVLNLFAYTCSFSVAAAAGGAASTTSVDISVKHLEWGKQNFALNDLSLDDHVFIRSDAVAYFKRAARQERRFDLIIIDPPTFAHGRKGADTFQVERDLPAVLRGAVELLEPGGVMLLSTNYRKLSRRRLEEWLKEAAGPRAVRILDRPALPADYAVDPNYAKSLLAQIE